MNETTTEVGWHHQREPRAHYLGFEPVSRFGHFHAGDDSSIPRGDMVFYNTSDLNPLPC